MYCICVYNAYNICINNCKIKQAILHLITFTINDLKSNFKDDMEWLVYLQHKHL